MASEVGKEEDRTQAEIENVKVTKRTAFSEKVKRHCTRFWWIDLIIFIAVVLIIVLPVVFVGYPRLAQKEINKSILNVTSMSQSNPAPDSFDLELTSVLTTSSKYHPELAAWNGSFHLGDSEKAFAYIDVPAIKADNGTQSHVKQRVQITNMDEYDKYTKTVLGTEQYVIYLVGKGTLKQGGLPKTTVSYHKEVTMKGLNGLKGFNLTDFNILTDEQEDGANANGTVFIPNPTILSIELGTLTLDLSVNGTAIGTSTIEDLVLKPGDNTFEMRAITNQTTVVSLLFTQYKEGIFPIDIVGNTTTFDNQSLSYYEQALQGNPLRVNLDIIDALERAGLAGLVGINSTSKI